ncbi:MAG: hypothetical protein P4L48_03200 [Mycobacterium sp.]|nr:hypothetical protein [Mycobacterium sp.]HKI40270.1 hypothetical protein [Mycobacterium sp.]
MTFDLKHRRRHNTTWPGAHEFAESVIRPVALDTTSAKSFPNPSCGWP